MLHKGSFYITSATSVLHVLVCWTVFLSLLECIPLLCTLSSIVMKCPCVCVALRNACVSVPGVPPSSACSFSTSHQKRERNLSAHMYHPHQFSLQSPFFFFPEAYKNLTATDWENKDIKNKYFCTWKYNKQVRLFVISQFVFCFATLNEDSYEQLLFKRILISLSNRETILAYRKWVSVCRGSSTLYLYVCSKCWYWNVRASSCSWFQFVFLMSIILLHMWQLSSAYGLRLH